MNSWLSVALITLNIFVSSIQCDSIKVNITCVTPHYFNSKYLNVSIEKTLTLNKNGYSEFPLHLEVLKDFPEETVLISKLLKSKSESGPWEDFQTYVSKVCDLEDEYHNVLPPFLIELTKDGNCIKKGKYNFDDAGQFQFDKLLPADSLKGWYFNTLNQIRTKNLGGVLLKEIEIKSKA